MSYIFAAEMSQMIRFWGSKNKHLSGGRKNVRYQKNVLKEILVTSQTNLSKLHNEKNC